ncbi:MAG: PRC-barrel domain-containing protein [Chloroflexota bacterium]
MRKGRTVIGQDVYSLADGLRLQSVKDLLVSESHDAIVALLVDEGGLLGTSTVVPIESVHRFGPDAVMVEASSAVVPASADSRVAAILDRKVTLVGTPVVTTEGARVGTIGDLYFAEDSGRILGYEVSGGTIGDVMRGTSWLPIDAIDTIGPDAVIAAPEAEQIVESQVGGVQAALDDARERAAATGQDLGDRLSSAVQDATASGSGDGDGEAAPPDPVAQDPDGAVVGHRTTTDVMDPEGAVLVAAGQRVTLDHVQRARSAGALDDLYAAVGMERPVPVSEQLASAASTAKETASDLWSRFTTRLSELSDDTGRRIDQQQTQAQLDRINDAIGRPVTKVFLDRDDNVILDLGDLITHQAVQRAYDAGMLDSLLASVYRMDVTFTQDQLKAPVRGDSPIEQAHGGATVVEELQHTVEELDAQGRTGSTDQAEKTTDQAEKTTDQSGAPGWAVPVPQPGAPGTELPAGDVRDQQGRASEEADAAEEARQDAMPPV